jgi:hypothetical protein
MVDTSGASVGSFVITAGSTSPRAVARVSPDMTASRLHSWEAVIRFTCGGHVVAAVLLICAPAAARAQTAAPPVYFIGGLYDAHTGATAEGGVLVPFHVNERGQKGEWGQNGKFVDCRCLEALAGVGTGGARLAIGPAFEDAVMPLFWVGADVLLTVVRTFDSPNAARPNTTYAGVEGGVMFMGIRARVGVAHAVSGRGRYGTVVTGNLGVRWQW